MARFPVPGNVYDWADDPMFMSPTSPLHHVTIERSDEVTTIRRKGDGGIVFQITDRDLRDDRARGLAEFLLDKLALLVCAQCGCPLIEGEADYCSPCESVTVMDLLGLYVDLT